MLSRLLLTLLLAATLLTSAQGQKLTNTGTEEFKKLATPTLSLRRQLFKGEINADPKDKNHIQAVEVAAKEVIYPLFWNTATRPKTKEINDLVERFDTTLLILSNPRYRANTTQTQQMFARSAIEAAAEILSEDSSKPIATINAARVLSLIPQRRAPRDVVQNEKEWAEEVLPRLAEGNAELLATTCLNLLDKPQANDGVRYYLFRALSHLMGMPNPPQGPLVKKETAEKVFAAAVKFIEKKTLFPKATPRQDIEGYKILRLQAVALLSQARQPTIGKNQLALTLARVAANDVAIVPPPRQEERVEAAIGLCRMGPATLKDKDFQPDYAVVQVARAVAAFGRDANANRESKVQQRLAPWAVEAARLLEAVESFKFEVKSPYVGRVCDQCVKQVLASAERRESSNHAGLTDWLDQNMPEKTPSLYKSDPGAVVKPGTEEAKEGKDEKEKDDN